MTTHRSWTALAATLVLLLAGSALAQSVTLRLFYPGWDSAAQEEAVTGLIA